MKNSILAVTPNVSKQKRKICISILTIAFSFLLTSQTNSRASQINTTNPPFQRESTVLFPEKILSFVVSDDVAWMGRVSDIIAFDLRKNSELWQHKLIMGTHAKNIAKYDGTVFVSTDQKKNTPKAQLLALDANTGELKWSLPRKGLSSAIGVGNGVIYSELAPFHISSIDAVTGKILWTMELSERNEESFSKDGELKAVQAVSGRVAVNCGNITYVLDALTGNILWHDKKSYLSNKRLISNDEILLIPYEDGILARGLKDGHKLWAKKTISYGDFAAVFQHWFVLLDNDRLQAINPSDGTIAWSQMMGPGGYVGNRYGAIIDETLIVRGGNRIGWFDKTGREFWQGPEKIAINLPIWSDGNTLVSLDNKRLLRYSHLKELEFQSGGPNGQVIAERLVSDFDHLDAAEKEHLKSLGGQAVGPVTKAYLKACDAYYQNRSADNSFDFYRRCSDLGKVLAKVVTGRHTPDLVKALENQHIHDNEKKLLLNLLAKHGNPDLVVPLFLKYMENETETSVLNTIISYISYAEHPDAVKFMISNLKDPNANPRLRRAGYVNLARTGGKKGLEAVLAERRRRTLLRPLEQRMELDRISSEGQEKSMPANLIEERTDNQGHVWGLLTSRVLGSNGDLWILKKENDHWIKPIFTGVSAYGISHWAESTQVEPMVGGKTGKELINGAWFEVLPANQELQHDTDKDGLTDIAEQRLGIDPLKKDTDGDGALDATDPWPNAAPRELSDAEQVLAAAFEARYHFSEEESPATFFAPNKLKPFEMVGWKGPVIWRSPDQKKWSLPLELYYEQGVAFLRFEKTSEGEDWTTQYITWNNDKTEAYVLISTYYGGLNGTGYGIKVRKFGEHWVVIMLEMEYIS